VKIPFGGVTRTCDDNIKVGSMGRGCESVWWINLDRDESRTFVMTVMDLFIP
jgi:hypothetical protein